ncbi:hypothetical protein BT69DRAFT_1340913 [Atractiella rhizophila]|nr:hypothetical protein BT69DRAFT_1340913 [Atractiella rhizophila]
MSSAHHNITPTAAPSSGTSSFENIRYQSIYADVPPTFEEALNSSAAKPETETDVKRKKWIFFGKEKGDKKERKPKVVHPEPNPPRPGTLPVGNFYDRPLLRVL